MVIRAFSTALPLETSLSPRHDTQALARSFGIFCPRGRADIRVCSKISIGKTATLRLRWVKPIMLRCHPRQNPRIAIMRQKMLFAVTADRTQRNSINAAIACQVVPDV